MQKYVAAFMFDQALERVALIRKTKPEWQAGLLNGIGGKVEPKESDVAAVTREFEEETGLYYPWMSDDLFLEIGDHPQKAEQYQEFSVSFFCSRGPTYDIGNPELHTTGEKIEIVEVKEIHLARTDMIENLPWIIGLAIDILTDGRPQFATATYPAYQGSLYVNPSP